MEVERMQDRAQGRVWSGAAALQQGLVDAIGGVPTAIAIAKQAAKIGGELCCELCALQNCRGDAAASQASSWSSGLRMLQQGCGWEHSCVRRCCRCMQTAAGRCHGKSAVHRCRLLQSMCSAARQPFWPSQGLASQPSVTAQQQQTPPAGLYPSCHRRYIEVSHPGSLTSNHRPSALVCRRGRACATPGGHH
jgi:Peptidase family S49